MRKTVYLCLKEIRHSYVLLILGTLLFTSIVTVSLFVSSTAANLSETFYDHANTTSPYADGFVVNIGGLRYDSLELVRDVGFKYTYPDADLFVEKGVFDIGEVNVRTAYELEGFEISAKEGEPFGYEDNGSYKAWLSPACALEKGLKTGDKIVWTIENKKKKTVREYEVCGILGEDRDCDILIPFEPYYKDVTDMGFHIEMSTKGVISDSRDVSKVYKKLRELKLSPSSDLDEEIKMLDMINVMVKVLFFLIVFAGAATLINIMNIVFRNRFKAIMRNRVIGLGSSCVIRIYSIIILVMAGISFALSYLANGYFSDHVYEITRKLFPEMTVSHASGEGVFLWIPVVTLPLICGCIYSFWRKLEKKELMELLEDKL
ncbi:MAG: hypothetical protein J5786_04690 [Clostridiales bacterium]|nr:hypothetical protein [Clostridiales bacterium]